MVAGSRGATIAACMVAVWTLLAIAAASIAFAADLAPAAASAGSNAGPAQPGAKGDTAPFSKIVAVTNKDTASASIGLNEHLAVAVDATGPVNAANYLLFLNGKALDGLPDATFDPDAHALAFLLESNSTNAATWAALLGGARGVRVPMSVALGPKPPQGMPATPTITGPAISFRVTAWWQVVVGLVLIAAMALVVWGGARWSNILKDNLLPQLAPSRQPYSLGRWQMAFWFSLIFASFVALYVLLWDPNTINAQALGLMGISGATALGAIAVDAAKNTPADDTNAALRALGIISYDDVLRVRQEIKTREDQLKATPAPGNAAQLQSEIVDRTLLLRTYERKVAPFASVGWYRDLTTDLNGSALHRVQVFCWTWVLGVVFVIEVWRSLAMPDFSPTLLALMGISSAGYVGFKYPEIQQ